MDLHALEQFLVVARVEHLSRAAEELRVAQPSLSRTIARLESELGTPLFDRGGRLRLNDQGRIFRQHVERSLGELSEGRRAIADADIGSVRLASETFLTLTGPIAAFRRAHPEIGVELQQMAADQMHRALHAREVDLCVASQPIRPQGLDSVHLYDEPVWLAVPIGHPFSTRQSVSVHELHDEPFVIPRRGHWQRRLLDQLFADSPSPRLVCEGDEAAATVALVGAGLGLTLVPDMARYAGTRAEVELVGIEDPLSRRVLSLHRTSDAAITAAVRLMHDCLVDWTWSPAALRGRR